MLSLAKNQWQQLRQALWQTHLSEQPFWKARLLILLRYIHLLVRDILQGQLNLHAMGLVFTTFLGIIPIVALTFFVLSIVNAEEQLPHILSFLTQPFGDKIAKAITEPAMTIAPNLDPKVLGSIGIGFLIYTAVTLIQKIESAFNFIWHVDESRGLLRRFGDYLVTIIVMGITLSVMLSLLDTATESSWLKDILNIEEVSSGLNALNIATPFLVMLAATTFGYIVMPNTKVHFSSALTGSLFATVGINIIGWIFVSFISTSSNYEAVYSGFAITVLVLIGIHMMWVVILLGARLAYYANDPRHLVADTTPDKFHGRTRERLALLIMQLVGCQFNNPNNKEPWTIHSIADYLHVPDRAVAEIADTLTAHHLLDQRADDTTTLYPSFALEHMTVKQVFDAVRNDSEHHWFSQRNQPQHPEVEAVIGLIEQCFTDTLGQTSLQSLVLAHQDIENIEDTSSQASGRASGQISSQASSQTSLLVEKPPENLRAQTPDDATLEPAQADVADEVVEKVKEQLPD